MAAYRLEPSRTVFSKFAKNFDGLRTYCIKFQEFIRLR